MVAVVAVVVVVAVAAVCVSRQFVNKRGLQIRPLGWVGAVQKQCHAASDVSLTSPWGPQQPLFTYQSSKFTDAFESLCAEESELINESSDAGRLFEAGGFVI